MSDYMHHVPAESFRFKVIRLWMMGYKPEQIADMVDDSVNHIHTVIMLMKLEYECAIRMGNTWKGEL